MNQRKPGADMRSNDARIAVLETTILNINSTLIEMRQDFRHYAERIDAKIDALDKKIDTKFGILDEKIDTKIEILNIKIDTLDAKFDTKFDNLNNRLWSNFLWLMGMIICVAGLVAHALHWI